MADRLNQLDVSFLYLEGPTTPMHVGGLAVFELPASGFDYDRFVDLIEQRISLVPRYRQKIKSVPGHLANPVWVDDNEFDLGYHVRRSALPRPGSDAQLRELVARVQSRPLDRNRPLWEMYLVEGAVRRPVRGHPEDPPRDGRRGQCDRHRSGHSRRDAGAAGGAGRSVGPPGRSRPRSPCWSTR